MTTYNIPAERCGFVLGYLQAIADQTIYVNKFDFTKVEPTTPAIIGAAKDLLGMLRADEKKMEEELDPYDDDEYDCLCGVSADADRIEELLAQYETL